MKETKVEVNGKYYNENCKSCPSLLRYNLTKAKDEKTHNYRYAGTVHCLFRNPECQFVIEAKRKAEAEAKKKKEAETNG